MSTSEIESEIREWSEQQGPHYHDTVWDHFWATLEWKDIELPSGKARHYDVQNEVDDEALGIFILDGEFYALQGSYSSWGSTWDGGVYKVEKRAVVTERWVTY